MMLNFRRALRRAIWLGSGLALLSSAPALAQSQGTLVKRSFLTDGTPLPDGSDVPSGTRIHFLMYLNNKGALLTDLSARDILDPAFTYVPGSMRVWNGTVACVAANCTPAEEATIYADVKVGVVGTDAVDGDQVAFVGNTFYAGNRHVASLQFNPTGNRVAALLLTAEVN
ncbi:MAG: hypothetical protein HKN12_06735 [Gemmatimonadetes bacterium]|nr:hypothetical protein [Gemmatimonadota bacterium]